MAALTPTVELGGDLAEALKHNTQLTKQACELEHKPHVFKIPGIDDKQFVAFKGEIVEHDIVEKLPERKFSAYDLDAFVALVARYHDVSGQATVWHANDRVLGLFDDMYRREQVEVNLPCTEARLVVAQLHSKVWKQQELIQTLKTSLNGTGLDPLLPLVRALNFVKREEAGGIVQQQSHSLGRQVEQQVIGLPSDFPEQLVARFAWWNVGVQALAPDAPRALAADDDELPDSTLLDTVVAVRVSITVDFDQQGLRLVALVDDLHRAKQHVHRVLHAWLVAGLPEGDAGVPVFHGQP